MIHPSVKFGHYCVIDGQRAEDIDRETANVEIGEGTIVNSFVEIRKETKIGKNCYIDSGVKISGDCKIGDNVTLRYDTIIARGCIIGNNVYFAPKCMTNNLDADENPIGGATVANKCFIGTGSILNHGIFIAHDTHIGANSYVKKPINEPYGTWVGTPAVKIK